MTALWTERTGEEGSGATVKLGALLGISEFLMCIAQYSHCHFTDIRQRLINEVSVPDGGTHQLSVIEFVLECQVYI